MSSYSAGYEEDKDVAASEGLLGYNQDKNILRTKTATGSSLFVLCLQVACMTLFMLSYLQLAYSHLNPSNFSGLLGNEGIYQDIPIEYETTLFQRAGFHDDRHNVKTWYEGRPNKNNNAAWEALVDAGMVAISSKENVKLQNGSAAVRGRPNDHIVELEMFHQLHCLKWLRDTFWALELPELRDQDFVAYTQRQNHTDHCIDYLRQTIMCHGDVTPITFEWNSGIDGYIAHRSTEHQCRNFDRIYAWARSRQNTGLSAGGKHVNVELDLPEASG